MLTRCAVKVVRSFMALFYDFPHVTSLVTIARRVRNARYITNVAPVRRAICFIVCLSLILSSQPVVPAGVGRSAEKPNVHLTQGPPSSNLPNLNEARVISNFPNMPYRDSGGMLAESAVKIANPRNDTNGGSASKDSRKEYGYRSRRLPVAAQSGDIVTVNPGAYQTPYDSGDLAVTSPSTLGHESTYTTSSAHATGGFGYAVDSDGRSARWSAFQSVSGVIVSIRLKFNWSVSGSASAGAADDGGSASSSCDFNIDYSLDGGSSWINRVSRSRSAVGNDAQSIDDSGSEDILLSVGQNITQVQVRDSMLTYADASGGESLRSNSGADITTSISLIRVEVELDTTAPVISSVAAGSITTTGATITWNTNENSDSQVEYGTDQTYGHSTTLNPALVTVHSQGLSGLTAGTPYHYRVKSKDAAGNLAMSGDFTFTATPPDTTPPTVTSFSPAAGATNVSLGANVTVTFSEAMNPATVNGSTVELRDPSNALVPATVSYNADSFTATLALSAPLSQGVTYTARVRGGGTDPRVKDVAGNALAADVTWTFITRSYTTLSLNMALIDPNNGIGSPGEDLLSRNCNWSLPLLALPGRAGLDLGLALSLNSLVYTRAGSVMYFDPNQEGYPAPGFRLGFPEIRNAFTNTEAGSQSYLLSMPSGRRVEFRQINTNVYEAVDSSYMLLTYDPVNSVFILYTADGTQCRFVDVTGSGDYKCMQIKDRNGNYITIGYGSLAEIRTVTDTLGRVINFNYVGSNRLDSITQNWGGQTHTWATFTYGTQMIQTNFPGLTLNGTANGAQKSVLTRVGLADGSVYSFEYNTYCQVKTIRHYAPNNSNPVNFPGDYLQLAYTTYGLPDNANNFQTDCPRITSRTDWASNWNSGVTSTYDADPGLAWGQVTFPDGTIYKEFFATAGWQRGLTTQTENWSGGVRKKWTTLQWTQDNTGVAYRLNPRVTETIVNDEVGNQRRTEMIYTSFGLVSDVKEYDANTTTVLRHMHTDYNLSAVYTGRRIIGLPSAEYLYDGNNTLFSKVTSEYDLGGEFLAHQGPPIQHDTANYGSGFVQGRGDLNRKRRWDVIDPDNPSAASEYGTGYNTSGSVVFTRDPLDHQTSFSYADSFSDGQNNRNTYAYPTTLTDPDTFTSTVQYNYDFGAVTQTQDPKLAAVTRTYDAAGRIERITKMVNGAYTRYVYAPDQRQVESFTTINDLNPANEFRSVTVFDGGGRLRGRASEHPGSVGGYKAQIFEYDVMGRLARQTNPTEIADPTGLGVNWTATGDDAGFVWRSQAYDWKSRPTVSTNQDGTTRSISYEGCGCSGGDVMTLTDEGTLVNGTPKQRKQKIYHDVLGREVKSEIYDWSNNVYTTTTQAYNVRDQVTQITRQQGSGGASQVTTFGYDGHGRLSTRQFPSASAPSNFVYNADDTLQVVTDARGAGSSFSYNNRGLVTGITYGAPDGVAATPNVTFAYDNAGNRTSMTDGLGSATYHYDSLSRMDWETRVLTGVGSFTMNYAYNLAGELTSVTDPANDSVT